MININQPTPEELEAHRQEEIAERKAEIETLKLRRIAEREQRERNLALAGKANAEQQKRRQEAERAQLTEGLDKHQIEDLDRLYELEPQITRSTGTVREDLQSEYNLILQRFLTKGRNCGTMTFAPVTIYISTTGQGLLIPSGNGNFVYREGSIGAFTTTDRTTEIDPKTKMLKIIAPSMIPKSNLSILNKWTVVIENKAPETQQPVKAAIPKGEDLSMTGFGFVRDAKGKWVRKADQETEVSKVSEEEPKKKRWGLI